MPVTGSNLSLRVPAQVAAVCGAAPDPADERGNRLWLGKVIEEAGRKVRYSLVVSRLDPSSPGIQSDVPPASGSSGRFK
jgi:hypothetical protein